MAVRFSIGDAWSALIRFRLADIHPALLYRSDRLQLDTFSPAVGTNQQSQNFTSDPSTGASQKTRAGRTPLTSDSRRRRGDDIHFVPR